VEINDELRYCLLNPGVGTQSLLLMSLMFFLLLLLSQFLILYPLTS